MAAYNLWAGTGRHRPAMRSAHKQPNASAELDAVKISFDSRRWNEQFDGCRDSVVEWHMDLNDYQRAALRTAAPRDKHNELFHLLLGLVGETGEIAEKAKKIVRDHDSDFSRWDREDLKKELGDTLWYVAVIADYFEIPLDDIARLNIAKLADRHSRAMIGGSGDNR